MSDYSWPGCDRWPVVYGDLDELPAVTLSEPRPAMSTSSDEPASPLSDDDAHALAERAASDPTFRWREWFTDTEWLHLAFWRRRLRESGQHANRRHRPWE